MDDYVLDEEDFAIVAALLGNKYQILSFCRKREYPANQNGCGAGLNLGARIAGRCIFHDDGQ
ncbi:hypothetical protein [Paenibacillus lautus]|uniref:hypothetical protein n=1 Tax=Paenibacillus lautus TaxID=1401 RepID=UPI001C7D0F03|nr:hypothetical protein [Paenibacillus lautus]